MPYEIRAPRASIAGFTPQAAPASTSAAPATGPQLSTADGPRPPAMRPLDDAPRAKERLAIIQAKADAGLDAWPQTAQLTEAVQDARGDLAHYKDKYRDEASGAEIARLSREADRAKRALEEHRASTAALQAEAHAHKAFYASAAKLISATNIGGKALRDVALKLNEFDYDTFGRLGETNSEIQAVEQAWVPIELAIAQMRARVERMAAGGMPRADVSLEYNGPHLRAKLRPVLNIHWPMQKVAAAPWPENSTDLPHVIDAAAVCCALFEKDILVRLEQDIEDCYRDHSEPTFTPEERRARLAELAAKKLQFEREIAENYWVDIEAGRAPEPSVTYLASLNLDPLALLGVEEEIRRTA